MQWWAWIAVGAILLVSELAFVDAQFYLVFVGASALLVGLLSVTELVHAAWLEWLSFAVVTSVSMFTFRRRFYDRLRRNLPVMPSGPAGESVWMTEGLAPGASCRIEHRGSSWNAFNGGPSLIAAGGRARIDRVEGLTLVVRGETAVSGDP